MGGVRYRVRRMLGARWGSALLLAVLVAFVGGLVLTLAAGTIRTATAPDRYKSELDDRWDTGMEQAEGPPVTEEVAALPAVDDVAAATFFFGGLTPAGPEALIEGITFVGSEEAMLAQVVEGHGVDPDAPNEFVATTSWVDEAGAEVGDEFTLFTISAESAAQGGFDAEPDGPMVDARLVGVISGAAELQDDFPLALFPLTLLDEGSIGLSASQILVSLAEGSDLSDLRQQLDELPEGDLLSLNATDPVPDHVRDAVGTQATALAVITAITALAGLVLLTQVATRQVRLADDQRVSLSAVGFTRAEVLAEGLGRVGAPAALGAIGAGALSFACSGLFPVGFVERVEPHPGLRFEPWVHLVGVLVLILGLLAVVGVLLIIGQRQRRERSTLVDRLLPRLGGARTAMGVRFAFARHARDAGSLSTPVLGGIFLLAALVASATYGASLDDLLEDPDRWGATWDLNAGQGGFEPIPDEVQDALLADPDVVGLTLLGATTVNIGEEALDVVGYEDVEGALAIPLLAGSPAADAGEIALGELAAHQFDVGIGDELTVQAPGGEQTLRVTGLVVVPGVEGADGIGEGGVMTAEGFADLDPEGALTASAIEVRDGASVEAARERLSEATGLEIGLFEPSTVITNYDRVRTAPAIVALLVGVILLLSVANLMVATLQRRGRDVALLRAVGADRRWLTAVEHVHAIAVASVVGVIGSVIGVAVGRVLFTSRVTDRMGAADVTVVPITLILFSVLALAAMCDLVAQISLRWRHASVARRLATE